MKMTKLKAFAAVAALTAGAAEARELRFTISPPEPSPWGQATKAFAENVAELSGGELTVNVFYANQLGSEQQTVRQIARGRLDMGLMSNTATSLLVPEFALLAVPYVFDSLDQADCVADQHLLDTYAEPFEAAGVRALEWVEVGHQIVFSKEAVDSIDALDNMKVRVAPTQTDTIFFEATGANAIPLGVNEVPSSLKTGSVTAATVPAVYGMAIGLPEIAPEITISNHVHQVGAILISDRTWETLSDEEKGWVSEASAVFKTLRQSVRGAESALVDKAASMEGVTVHRPDLGAWRTLAQENHQRIVDAIGGDADTAWEELQAAKKSCAG
ncbi:TRAP transporter substrate-binding protein DctP [Maritimibacter sp. UBA3975]|uniref:TRAP transporter substrate-binding protein n=1 Tax=Maritimibacter sp. UBA3975 TaxID=1946833 RepID=UPI0025B90B0E|nr:TRAP transporter substrate-binding protein DctP [Maritimibacter sp. UBA3975]|tara:strand:- start:28878 stop:29864 length:987 start_codon:yes stop_codon:yes gene_type:complete